MANHHNIIIIGFGSAACAAALNASLLGHTVLVVAGSKIKQNENLRPSESVHPGLFSLLDHLHCGDLPSACIRGTYNGILANERKVDLGEDQRGIWEGMHIDKEKFLNFLREKISSVSNIRILYDKAQKVVYSDTRVTGVKTSEGFEFACDYLIDCSGRFHFAAKQLGLKKNIFSPSLVCWSGVAKNISDEILQKTSTSFYSNGWSWTWFAPENNGVCTWTRLCLKGESDFKPPKLLEEFQNESPIVFSMRWHIYSPLAVKGLLVCGDAGAIIDPAAGQGIFFSMLSAIASTESIDKCLKDRQNENIFLTEYDRWFTEQYMEKLIRLKNYYESHVL